MVIAAVMTVLGIILFAACSGDRKDGKYKKLKIVLTIAGLILTIAGIGLGFIDMTTGMGGFLSRFVDTAQRRR